MAESKGAKPGQKKRPRSKRFLSMSQDNSYAHLGVSPLASTEEIAALITKLRGEAMRRIKRGIGSEEEVLRLDRIHEEIGIPAARKKYDEKHPQNVLLTVQPSQAEQTWLPHRRSGLISEWLYEELGEDEFIPTPRCLGLWNPGGLDEQLVALLARFGAENAEGGGAGASPQQQQQPPPGDGSQRVLPSDLERLLKEEEDV
jgi:hypothetical protein